MGFCPQTNLRLSNFLERKGTPVRTLRAFLPVCVRCEHSLVGGGQRAAGATVVPESPVPALKFPREHCSVTILDPTSDPHSSPTERRGGARKATDRKELHSFMLQ